MANQDFLAATTKIRWQRMGMGTVEIQRWKGDSVISDEEKVEEVIAMEEREFKEEDSTVSLLRKRCTSMKTNRSVHAST